MMRVEIVNQLVGYYQAQISSRELWQGFADGVGATAEEITEAKRRFEQTTQDQTTQHSQVDQTSGHSKHFSASQILLALGIALVIVATIVIITYSWPELSPISRFLAVAIPNAIILLISLLTGKNPMLNHIKQGTHVTGLIMLPVSAGVFLYQFGIINDINSPALFLWSLLLVLPVYIFYDLYQKLNYAAILTLVDVFGLISFLISYLQIESLEFVTAIYLLSGLMSLTIAWMAKKMQDNRHLLPYSVYGALVLFFDLPFFVWAIFGGDSFFGGGDTASLLATSLIGGSALFLAALMIGKLFKPTTELEHALQKFLMLGFLATLFLPLFMLSSDEKIYSILNIVFGIAVLLVGTIFGISLLFYGGLVGFIYGLLIPLLTFVSGISIPILLFLIGIIAILLSIFVAKSSLVKKSFYFESVALYLGAISDSQASQLTAQKFLSKNRGFSFVYGCVVISLALWLIPMLVGLILNGLKG